MPDITVIEIPSLGVAEPLAAQISLFVDGRCSPVDRVRLLYAPSPEAGLEEGYTARRCLFFTAGCFVYPHVVSIHLRKSKHLFIASP
jgi:hypothetical protein